MYSVKESDWKLFRKLLPEWQERLLREGAISKDDLDGFSEELRQSLTTCF